MRQIKSDTDHMASQMAKDTSALPALASNINTILESVRQMEAQMRGVTARVEEMDRKLTGATMGDD